MGGGRGEASVCVSLMRGDGCSALRDSNHRWINNAALFSLCHFKMSLFETREEDGGRRDTLLLSSNLLFTRTR